MSSKEAQIILLMINIDVSFLGALLRTVAATSVSPQPPGSCSYAINLKILRRLVLELSHSQTRRPRRPAR